MFSPAARSAVTYDLHRGYGAFPTPPCVTLDSGRMMLSCVRVIVFGDVCWLFDMVRVEINQQGSLFVLLSLLFSLMLSYGKHSCACCGNLFHMHVFALLQEVP